jgi:DNA-binding CsgD family transcriptional regulator
MALARDAGCCLSHFALAGTRFVVLSGTTQDEPAWVATLTVAERAVLFHLGRGMTNVEIAAARGCGPPTVAKQIASLKEKSSCTNREELAIQARRLRSGTSQPGYRSHA